jgi:hypothetical protein
MTNLLAQAINCDDPDQAARIIRDALGIESDDVVNYCFPTTWPIDRSGAPVTSASGSRPKRVTSARDAPPLPAALVRRGDQRLLHHPRPREEFDLHQEYIEPRAYTELRPGALTLM